MASKFSKKWIVIPLVLVVGGVLAYQYWKSTQSLLPAGIVSGNGRIEATLTDASAKEPLRVKEVLVNEGDLVRPGQVLVQLDTTTIDAELAERLRAARCPRCGGPLCAGHYERKPRGGSVAGAGEGAEFRQRFSFCCGREGCRKRATPPSVRFLGRKVYVEVAILIACTIVPWIEQTRRAIREVTGIAARTVRRWQQWWRTVFVGSPNQSVVAPCSRSKSSVESGPSARTRASTCSATSAFSASVRAGARLRFPRNHGNSLVRTKDSPLLYASKISRRS